MTDGKNHPSAAGDDRVEYRQLIDRLVKECQSGQGHIAAGAGDASAAFAAGVHTVLVALHEAAMPPFDDGYEGTPFLEFMGRLQGLPWPRFKE